MPECFTPMMNRNTGAQLQRLAKSSYKVEARATGTLYKTKLTIKFMSSFLCYVVSDPFIFALRKRDDIYCHFEIYPLLSCCRFNRQAAGYT
jgi:hypothetical protein